MFHAPHGINFSSQVLAAPDLARALCRTVSFIQDIEPYGVHFQHLEDWWEHDGLHFHKGSISLHELFEMVKSPQSLLFATPSDEFVFVGIAPESANWYLRFRLCWDDDGFYLNGKFDITLPAELAPRFAQWISNSVILQEQESLVYYDSIRA